MGEQSNVLRALRWGAIAGLAVLLGWIAAFGWGSTALWPTTNREPAVRAMAYTGYARWGDPQTGAPTPTQTLADLQALRQVTRHLRTYSSTEMPHIPAIAARAQFSLTAGAWLDQREANNQREVNALIDQARENRHITQVVVGNETLLLRKLEPAQLLQTISAVKAAILQPVGTAEPWHVWLAHPELAAKVDFLMVHLLPYWEGVRAEDAVGYALQRLAQVQQRYPNKRIVIGEFGWPSAGPQRGAAIASPALQAKVTQEFVRAMRTRPTDYFLMEAIDQPWKISLEGTVGAHWGWLDAARQPKFSLEAPLPGQALQAPAVRPYWRQPAVIAALLSAVIVGLVCTLFSRWQWRATAAFVVLACSLISLSAWAVAEPLRFYLQPWQIVGWLLVVIAVCIGLAVLLVVLIEAIDVWFKEHLPGRIAARSWVGPEAQPLVSIHLACSNEPAEMVIATINSVIALHYRPIELIVVDNNTTDPACWQPVCAHIDHLKSRGHAVSFEHHPQLAGYKAGALCRALASTDSRASFVAVVDADYLVHPQWLDRVMGHFQEPEVALVQCPQAHRGASEPGLAQAMNAEYEGFFRMGMHHRHERNAIIQHGTMCVVRRSSLEAVGSWSDATVCEDTELGLRLLAFGFKARYLDEVLGQGLLPAGFAQYCRQRRRWSMGAMQIMKHHARTLLGSRSRLSAAQRYHFLAGWLPWIGEALNLLMVLTMMVWTLGMLIIPAWFGRPDPALALPLLVFFGLRLATNMLVYRRCVSARGSEIRGATLAGMALSLVVAQGVLQGLWTRDRHFEITGKAAGLKQKSSLKPAREPLLLALGLAVCAIAGLLIPTEPSSGAAWWAAMLGVLALPYLVAGYAAWRGIGLMAPALDRGPLWHTKSSIVLRDANEAE